MRFVTSRGQFLLCYSPAVIADSYIVPRCVFSSGSLGGLIALYEANFIRFGALLPKLPESGQHLVSSSPDDLPVQLAVESASRYTRDLRLTYLFVEGTTLVAEPDLRLRLFLDARMAEVRSWSAGPRHEWLGSLAGEHTRELDRRWSRNMMLAKWLDYLAERRHAFKLSTASTLAAPLPG